MSRKRKRNRQHLSNKSQQPSNVNLELLKVAQDTKVWVQKLKADTSLLNRINAIEQRLKKTPARGQMKNYGESEREQLRAIRKVLRKKAGRRRRWARRGLMLANLFKVIIYFRAYLLNIPQKQFNANQAFYIFSGVVIFSLFYLYMYILLRFYLSFYFRYLQVRVLKMPRRNIIVYFLLYATIYDYNTTMTLFVVSHLAPDFLPPSLAIPFNSVITWLDSLLHSNFAFDLATLGGLLTFIPVFTGGYGYLKKILRRYSEDDDDLL